MVGGNRTRLHEEVIVAGGEITDGRRFRRMNVGETQGLLDVERDAEPSQPVKDRLSGMWQAIEGSLHSALEARSAERLKSLERMLADRRAKEEADIRTILAELERRIREELDTQPQYIQLALFSPSEQEQYSRNVAALRARLEQIPQELEHELKAIRTRYEVVQPRLFPMAVTFLIPARLAR